MNEHEVYIKEMSEILFSDEKSKDEQRTIVMGICRDGFLLNPNLWSGIGGNESFVEFISKLVDLMISFGEEGISYKDLESFCVNGEVLSAELEQPKKWIYFKKLRICLLIKYRKPKEARAALDELEEMIPEDSFIKATSDIIKLYFKIECENINEIDDFSEYLDYLIYHADKYVVLIAGCDTPWGEGLSPALAEKLMQLGTKNNLYGQFRCGYVAAVFDGIALAEVLTQRGVEAKWTGQIGRSDVELVSHGAEAVPCLANIKIDGSICSIGDRGLNFVVYSKEKCAVIDSVCFDTYSKNNICKRKDELKKGLLKWHENHPGVGIVCFNMPAFPQKDLSQAEKLISDKGISRAMNIEMADNPNLPIRAYLHSKEDVEEVLTTPKSYHNALGVRRFEDKSGKLVNIAGGHRVTKDQPDDGRRVIYILGGCKVFGVGCPDDGTIASHLQRFCNERIPNEHFIVQNYGFYLAETDSRQSEELAILNSIPVKRGDIVLCGWGFPEEIPLVNCSHLGERPHARGELFHDIMAHLTPDGSRAVSECIFMKLEELGFFTELADGKLNTEKSVAPVGNTLEKSTGGQENEHEEKIVELKKYKDELRKIYDDNFSVGAIVMNCNPFTLGHRYLIEEAKKQCAHLIIFVVEEDKSFFQFEDRLRLVREGIKDIENITILPSGQFILSSMTFSEYFNKSELQNVKIDSSTDVLLFAEEIAPVLHITKRFIGTEPYDTVTRQYNNDMKTILPQYGISVIEIPRKEYGNGKAISASEVRKCLETHDLQRLRSLVPDTTYAFLASIEKSD